MTHDTAAIDRMLAAADGEDHEAVDGLIKNSWQRSAKAYRVDPTSDRAPHLLTTRELSERREPAQRSLAAAQDELDRLYTLVRPVHYVILLCDRNGVVIDHRGEESEAPQFRFWGTWLGGVWAEDIEGTNGIGTSIAERRPVTVHRSQHFRARHMNLSCSGAPVFGTDGELAGVLDVSSIDPTLSEHAHALTGALTVSFARAIEERLFRSEFRRSWVIAVRIPSTPVSAMLMAVDRDQRIVAVDRIGRAVLARWEHRLDGGLALWTVFERNDNALYRNDYVDCWIQLQPRGTADVWPAIITPPEPQSIARCPTEDMHVRPRIDMLLAPREPLQAAPATRGGLPPAALRRVRDHIHSHLDQTIDLKSLAAIAGLSPFYFARAFKRSEGKTPHGYVLARRIAKAGELLKRRDLTLAQIASLTGFADQSHFTRRFRQATGVSPGHFRKALN